MPTFAALCRRVEHATEDILLGFDTHFDASIALARAVTELNQYLVAYLVSDDEKKPY
jgi:ribosomal protein S12 methylthiotransferase accessory factor